MIDVFYEYENPNVTINVNDITPYSCATEIRSVTLKLQAPANELFSWF